MHLPQSPAVPHAIRLADYRPPDYRIETVNLEFDLDETRTVVRSLLTVVCRHERCDGIRPLVLYGKDLVLRRILLDGRLLAEHDYTIDGETLTLIPVPDRFVLEIETEINPTANTELSGLYLSGSGFVTQCEAEGFRKITYFPDRPDVMARFLTTIVADRKKYPVLLSNGNLLERRDLPDGRHLAKWHDPFPKPSYLFALVAGDLARIEDSFTTRSGRKVDLHVYVQHHNRDKCGHAMESLKKAMRWDEETYGREYDLDLFMIVATDDFNMGAMENKGLNIFNSKYVLARPETATDADFNGIMGVVGHEYFHNWSGDRVTCRDWFQLSLKEGFTVFRDQQFMEDMTSRGVKRIGDVNVLRTYQFREDAGPMAHPVRPDSYVEINNFYTVTVYNKGAEVIRMLRTILGPDRFRKGTDLYFSRHDGQAVTTEDFIKALEDASGVDLAQFRRWYTQAGTPVLNVTRSYDPAARAYTLTFRQSCPPTPGQQEKLPFHIPVAVGLLGRNGRELEMQLDRTSGRSGEGRPNSSEREMRQRGDTGTITLELTMAEETFVFRDVPEEPVPSLLRGFSAPVRVKIDLDKDERVFLMAHDGDPFNRWDAGQQLAVSMLLGMVQAYQAGGELSVDQQFMDAFRVNLESEMQDKAFQAFALTLPSETYLADFLPEIDPAAVHEACEYARRALAAAYRESFHRTYQANADTGPYRTDQAAMGRRSLKNTCLSYLTELEDADIRKLCVDQFRTAGNMTDTVAALVNLANTACPERDEALHAFQEQWRDAPLVMDKWLAIQATSRLPDTLDRVKGLMKHPVFTLRNPNKVRSLIGAFAANPARFHDASGAGYAFVADQVIAIDALNPQIAARLATAFTLWRRYEGRRKGMMQEQLERVMKTKRLSKDVYEVVSKSLL